MQNLRPDVSPRRTSLEGVEFVPSCSRRRLFGAAAGVGGAALAARLLSAAPAIAHGDDHHDCRDCRAEPIPGGIRPGGPGTTLFHIFPPDPSAPQLLEPATITNFSGFLGLADVRGTGTETNRMTGAERKVSWEVDLRFFDGFIAGHDGRSLARCTFGFVWLDVYEPGQFDPAHQLHDYNPGIAPNGLFWTVAIENGDVSHDHLPGTVRARMDVQRLHVEDYHNLLNALADGPSVPARVSFDVAWARGGELATVCDEANTFEGVFRKTTADVSWSARSREATFTSEQVTDQVLSIVGHEDNGVFHDCEAGDF